MIKREILQDLDWDDLALSPYWIMMWLPPSAPPGLEATLMPNPGPGEISATATAPPPAFLEFLEPPFWQAPIPMTEASGQLPGSDSSRTAQAIPASPGEYCRKGRETLELSRGCALPESRREQKRTDEIYSASCCSGKVYLRPSRKPHLPQGQDSSSTGPKGGPRPRYSQTSVPSAELLATGRVNVLRQGRKKNIPQLWDLLTWKLNRAAGAQRYQVPESPW